jgi:hypothetical protein
LNEKRGILVKFQVSMLEVTELQSWKRNIVLNPNYVIKPDNDGFDAFDPSIDSGRRNAQRSVNSNVIRRQKICSPTRRVDHSP